MSSVVSSLKEEDERTLQSFFTKAVRFHLLYKSSFHGGNIQTLLSKFENGNFVIAVFLQSGLIRGGYTSKNIQHKNEYADADAFVFEITRNNAKRFLVLDSAKAVSVRSPDGSLFSNISIFFGGCVHLYFENDRLCAGFCTDATYHTGWREKKHLSVDVELHRVQELEDVLGSPWREVHWTNGTREVMRTNLISCKLKLETLSRVNALLLGPVGSGKSSLVSSIRSTMYRRVVHLPIIGSSAGAFTKKLTSYDIRAEKGGSPTPLTLCDVMGIGNEDSPGLSLPDALAVIRGHVPEGYKFQREVPISDKVSGYRATPALKDQIHCVLYVLDASKVESYSTSLSSILSELHTTVSELGVPQLILLTHVDKVCPKAELDAKSVYYSRTLKAKMQSAAELVGLPLSYVLPVKNYISQLSVDCNTDILLLSVVNSILQAVDDTLEDRYPGVIIEILTPAPSAVGF